MTVIETILVKLWPGGLTYDKKHRTIIWNPWRKWRKQVKAKHRRLGRKRLRKLIRDLQETDNAGRMTRLLVEHPSIQRVTTETGGFARGYCDIYLHDGYHFTGSGLFRADVIRSAAARTIQHLRRTE